jgi:DNA adenine methylase
MKNWEHVNLANLLKTLKGKVAVSGYRGDLMDELYKDWKMHVGPTKKALSVKEERTEVLWTNY